MRKPQLSIAALLLALAAASPPVFAQSNAQNLALAESLYNEAMKLSRAEKYKEAKEKLEASLALDPGIGTLANLAWVEDKLGNTASAWSRFSEALALARQKKDERIKRLEEDVKRMEPRLSKILLDIAPENQAGTVELRRDGGAIPVGAWTSPIPVDPGEHTFEAVGRGKIPWKTTVVIEPRPGVTTVRVPALQKAPEEATPAPVQGDTAGSTQRTAGFAVLGVGGAGLLVGAITLGLDASKHASLAGQCGMNLCPRSLQDDVSSYHRLGITASSSLAVGGALAVTGLVVALTAPKSAPRAAALMPAVGPGFVGLHGRFQ